MSTRNRHVEAKKMYVDLYIKINFIYIYIYIYIKRERERERVRDRERGRQTDRRDRKKKGWEGIKSRTNYAYRQCHV